VHLGFVTGDYLVGSLAQVFVEVEAVDCMASRADCFGPKNIRSLVLIKHGSCSFNQYPILSLHDAILLSVWSGELTIDPISSRNSSTLVFRNPEPLSLLMFLIFS
jgi:hypothetical protein